ncbi:MAG: hypothetical protein M3279_07060 [Actinomycetota bacterium]|nr:hypothetical protein [Actinomycetota bacterium]
MPVFSNRDMLRPAAFAFAVGFAVHGLDHLRRGLDASPQEVVAVGTLQGVFVAIAVVMAVTGREGAPAAAVVVGFGSVLLFTYGHLLPVSPDGFAAEPHTNVTWFSWATAVAEIGTALLFGAAGARALRPGRSTSSPVS